MRRASDNAAQAILYCVFAFFQPFIYCLLRGNGPRKTRRKVAETKRNIDSAHDTKQVALAHIVIQQRVLCNDHNSLYGMLIACLAFPLSSASVSPPTNCSFPSPPSRLFSLQCEAKLIHNKPNNMRYIIEFKYNHTLYINLYLYLRIYLHIYLQYTSVVSPLSWQ